MKPRSPVLGYNHNVRYSGRMWHVQTEDSGVNNPHVFTHLFTGGTILASKRLDYDASSEVQVVQKLMQAQHKAMLRELKSGALDQKIEKLFGEPVVKEPEGATEPVAEGRAAGTDPNLRVIEAEPAGSGEEVPTERDLEPPPKRQAPAAAPLPLPPPGPAPARSTSTGRTRRPTPPPSSVPQRTRSPSVPNLQPARPAVTVAASRPSSSNVPRSGGVGGGRPANAGQAYNKQPTAEGVVVARPAVIVGGDAPRASQPTSANDFWQTQQRPSPAPPAAATPQAPDNLFGGDLISEKSLDEVILAYLSEDLTEK
jgi:hypothetical protein